MALSGKRPPGGAPAGAPGPLAVDRLLLVYLGATGLVAAASLRLPGLLLAGAHAGAVALVYPAARRIGLPAGARGRGGTAGERAGGSGDGRGRAAADVARFVRLFYPVLLTPLLYHEVSVLGQLHADGFFDPVVQGWEEALFGLQPAAAARRWLPWAWLSESLHLGYVSYYLLVPGAALAVHLRGTPRDLHRAAVTVALAFFTSYLVFAVFPVEGPRYLFATLDGAAAGGPVEELTHWILERGSSRGTAFPSSHVAAAVGAWLATRRPAPGWFRWSAPLVWLLVAGTVYGGFHYAVDALAGLAVAAAAAAATPALCRRWGEPSPAGPEAAGAPGAPGEGHTPGDGSAPAGGRGHGPIPPPGPGQP